MLLRAFLLILLVTNVSAASKKLYPLYSVYNGRVSDIDKNSITISHLNIADYTYQELDIISVQYGDDIQRGDIIGYVYNIDSIVIMANGHVVYQNQQFVDSYENHVE